MAGELIGLLRLLRLRKILRATVTSKEFQDNWLKTFRRECLIIESNEFWKYLFTLCRALYAPMRILRLADQKIPAMDKLHYYVLQTDVLLQKYLKMAEDDSGRLLNADNTMASMSLMVGMADTYSNESDEDDDDTDEDDNDSDDDAEDSGDELANFFQNDNNNADDGIINENATLNDRCG